MKTPVVVVSIVVKSHLCTPPASQDTFSEKFSTSTGSSKEKVGLKKKMNNNNDDTKIVKSHMNHFFKMKGGVGMAYSYYDNCRDV